MVRNHQGNKQPIEPSLVNQTTSKADYTTKLINVLLLQNKRIEKKACYITTNWILRTFFIADLQGLSILSI